MCTVDLPARCSAGLSLKKIRNIAPKFLNKQFVEALVLSKVDYVDFVVYPLPQCLEAKLQRVQKSAPSFGNSRYAKMADIIQCIRMAPCKGKNRNAFIMNNP